MDRAGILNPSILAPRIPERPNEENSIQCEMSLAAAREALAQANTTADRIGAVIVACSNMQRAYPAISIEVQEALGAKGFAFDLNVACSSATFGIAMVSPTVTSASSARSAPVTRSAA
jgi:beta-ketodecanoyl-[acyl-carrier-protein] synthase